MKGHHKGKDYRIEELNKRHAIVMLGGKCVIMNEVTDPFDRPDVTFSSVADFRLHYANRKIEIRNAGGETEFYPLANEWLESPHRRQYEGIVFSPGGEVPGYYNLWKDFAVEPLPGLDWSLFRNLIREDICNGNEEHFQYLINWMADIVQNPGGERPGVSIVLRGEQGVGKSTFVTQFGRLFGAHFLHVTSPNQFIGRFNQHLKDCMLCFCDEGFLAGNKESAGVLKALITEDTVRIEPKGKEAFSVKNHVRLIVASNNDWIIPAGNKERRFFVLDVGNKHIQDHEYFSAICNQMETGGGGEAMMHDLLQVDLSGVNLRKFPQTQALFEQKLHTADSVTKWWVHRLQEGSQVAVLGEWTEVVPTRALHIDYVEYLKDLKVRHIVENALFARQLRKLCPGVQGPHKKTVSDFIYCLGSKRMNCLSFPPLEECRSAFEQEIGSTVPWEGEGG